MAGASVVATGRWNAGNLRRGAQQDLNYLQRQASGFSKSVVASFGGIGAAMGGIFAAGAVVDFFKQSAQAAMEDEKSMASLAKTMDNVGQGFRTTGIEDLIGKMQLATGVADTELRSAFQKLVTVTRDAAKSQDLLQVAMDVSAGTGKDLEAVSMALAKAAGGQTTALQRLGVGLDVATLKSKDMDAITAELSQKFQGQAAVAANTYEGQMRRVTAAVGEAQEAIGYALLNSLNDLVDALGGTGGVQQAILDLGNYIAGIITDFGKLSSAVATMADGINDFGNNLGYSGKIAEVFGNIVKYLLQPGLATLGQTVERLGIIWNAMPDWMRNALNATMGWTVGVRIADAAGKNLTTQANKLSLEHEHLARAATNAQPALAGLADETDNAASKAWDGSQSYLAFATSIAMADSMARDFGNTSATVQAAIQQGVATGGVPGYWQKIQQQYGETAKQARSAAGGTKELSKAQEEAKQSSQELQQNVESLATSLQGLVDEVSPPIATAANATFDAISKQVEKFKSTLAEAKSYAQGIVDGFMGQLDLGKALDDAKATGTSLVEAFVKQGDKVIEFGRKMNDLLKQGLSKAAFDDIMALGYERGTEVANALSDGNVAGNIASVNKVYESVKTMAEQVAEAAASAFYKAGLDTILMLIRAMVEALGIGGKGRKRLMNLMDELAALMSRDVIFTVRTVVEGSGVPSAISAGGVSIPTTGMSSPEVSDLIDGILNSGGTPVPVFADGGIATRPTPGIFGEAGPEALIPLDRMGDFGGNTYQITVQAGVGDPRAIGKSVVEAITLFERSSGPVFARA